MSFLDRVSLIKIEIASLCFFSQNESKRERETKEKHFKKRKNEENIFLLL